MTITECINQFWSNKKNKYNLNPLDVNLLDTPEDVILANTLNKISMAHYDCTTDNYPPLFTLADGSRTFIPSDLTDSEWKALYSLDLSSTTPYFKSHIAAIIWKERRDYDYGKLAIASLKEIYYDNINDDEDYCFDVIHHALKIALQFGEKSPQYIELSSFLTGEVKRIDEETSSFLAVELISLIYDNKLEDIENFIPILEKQRIAAEQQANDYKIRTICDIEISILKKLKRIDEKNSFLNRQALYYEKQASLCIGEDYAQLTEKSEFYRKALKYYWEAKNEEKAIILKKKLIFTQKAASNSMSTISKTFAIDTEKYNQWISNIDSSKSTLEKIVRLCKLVHLHEYEELKNLVLKELKTKLIESSMNIHIYDDLGNITSIIRGMNLSAIEYSSEEIEPRMHHLLYEIATWEGAIFLKPLIEKIIITNIDDLDYLVDNSYFIPQDRRKIYKTGFDLMFQGNYYAASSILAPQIENSFRHVAEMCDALIVRFTDISGFTTSQVKNFGEILNSPEVKDCFDNDIIFLFKSLMIEKTGANIRNRIAHGLYTYDSESSNGILIYFLCCILKLCCITILPPQFKDFKDSYSKS